MWCWLYSFIVRQSNYLIFAVIWSTFFEFLLFFLKVSLLYSTFFLGHRKLEVCAGSDPRSATQLELCEDQHNREETTSPALFLFQTFASFEWISDCMTTCTGRRFFVRQSADRSACWEVSLSAARLFVLLLLSFWTQTGEQLRLRLTFAKLSNVCFHTNYSCVEWCSVCALKLTLARTQLGARAPMTRELS